MADPRRHFCEPMIRPGDRGQPLTPCMHVTDPNLKMHKNKKIEEIRSKMIEKRKIQARAEANGSFNKSFGNKRNCPNASAVLKASLKSNNKALARSNKVLKHENRMAQDMILYLQNEQHELLLSIYRMKQNEKENMKRRKEIQTALHKVTSSLLTTGNQLGHALELTTSFPVRDSLMTLSPMSEDDSIRKKASSIGPSIYYRKPSFQQSSQPPLKASEKALPSEDPGCLDDDITSYQSVDPAAECIDPSMLKDLEFDIPLMFTDDNVSEIDGSKNDTNPCKRSTKNSRISGLVDTTCAHIARKSKRSSSNYALTGVNPPANNTRSRSTFVISQDIAESVEDSYNPRTSRGFVSTSLQSPHLASAVLNKTFEIEDKESPHSQSSEMSVQGQQINESENMDRSIEKPIEKTKFKGVDTKATSPQPLSLACKFLNQTVEIEDKDRPNSRGIKISLQTEPKNKSEDTNSSSITKEIEKTTYKVVDMELTELESKETSTGHQQELFNVPMKDNLSDMSGKGVQNVSNSGKTCAKAAKKKSKLQLKKAKTKVTLKKKDLQDTFQSPKSPLMSPSIARYEPSPVFGKAKKKRVIMNSCRNKKADLNVTSVFDLSEGDTFTEAKSFVCPTAHKSTIAEGYVKTKQNAKKENEKNVIIQDCSGKSVKNDSNKEKPAKSKTTKEKVIAKQMPDTKETIKVGLATSLTGDHIDLMESKIKRKSRKSKSVVAPEGRGTNTKMPHENSTDASDAINSKKQEGSNKSTFHELDELNEDASLLFITKPIIHRTSKKRKKNKICTSAFNGDKLDTKNTTVVPLTSQVDDKEYPSKNSVASSDVNGSSDFKISIETDLLQDIDMFDELKNCKMDTTSIPDKLERKILKPRKRSSIPVRSAIEWNTNYDSLKLDTASKDIPKIPSTSRRSSGSPVLNRKKKLQKRRLIIESYDSDDEDVDIVATGREGTKEAKRQKRSPQQSIEYQEVDTCMHESPNRDGDRRRCSKSQEKSVTHKEQQDDNADMLEPVNSGISRQRSLRKSVTQEHNLFNVREKIDDCVRRNSMVSKDAFADSTSDQLQPELGHMIQEIVEVDRIKDFAETDDIQIGKVPSPVKINKGKRNTNQIKKNTKKTRAENTEDQIKDIPCSVPKKKNVNKSSADSTDNQISNTQGANSKKKNTNKSSVMKYSMVQNDALGTEKDNPVTEILKNNRLSSRKSVIQKNIVSSGCEKIDDVVRRDGKCGKDVCADGKSNQLQLELEHIIQEIVDEDKIKDFAETDDIQTDIGKEPSLVKINKGKRNTNKIKRNTKKTKAENTEDQIKDIPCSVPKKKNVNKSSAMKYSKVQNDALGTEIDNPVTETLKNNRLSSRKSVTQKNIVSSGCKKIDDVVRRDSKCGKDVCADGKSNQLQPELEHMIQETVEEEKIYDFAKTNDIVAASCKELSSVKANKGESKTNKKKKSTKKTQADSTDNQISNTQGENTKKKDTNKLSVMRDSKVQNDALETETEHHPVTEILRNNGLSSRNGDTLKNNVLHECEAIDGVRRNIASSKDAYVKGTSNQLQPEYGHVIQETVEEKKIHDFAETNDIQAAGSKELSPVKVNKGKRSTNKKKKNANNIQAESTEDQIPDTQYANKKKENKPSTMRDSKAQIDETEKEHCPVTENLKNNELSSCLKNKNTSNYSIGNSNKAAVNFQGIQESKQEVPETTGRRSSRRSAQTVSYRPVPLNFKLRRGDDQKLLADIKKVEKKQVRRTPLDNVINTIDMTGAVTPGSESAE